MYVLTSANIATFNATGIAELFTIFKRDFIDHQTYISQGSTQFLISVKEYDTCPCPFSHEAKPEGFWHIITTDKNVTKDNKVNPCPDIQEKKRRYDSARAKRIHWIKLIIDALETDRDIKHFYQKRGNKINLILWHTTRDFLVIIRKLSHSSDKFLVSSYLIHSNQRYRYKKQLKEYEENKPTGLEWF